MATLMFERVVGVTLSSLMPLRRAGRRELIARHTSTVRAGTDDPVTTTKRGTTTMTTTDEHDIDVESINLTDPAFWKTSLEQRQAGFAALRRHKPIAFFE